SLLIRPPPSSPLFPYTTLFRSSQRGVQHRPALGDVDRLAGEHRRPAVLDAGGACQGEEPRHHLLGDAVLRIVEEQMRIETRVERSEEHTSELQSRENLVCRLLL